MTHQTKRIILGVVIGIALLYTLLCVYSALVISRYSHATPGPERHRSLLGNTLSEFFDGPDFLENAFPSCDEKNLFSCMIHPDCQSRVIRANPQTGAPPNVGKRICEPHI